MKRDSDDTEKAKRVEWLQERAAQLRLKCDGNRTQAGGLLGVTRQMHYEMENNEFDPATIDFQTIARLCFALKISINDAAIDLGLISDDEDRLPPKEGGAMNKKAVKRISAYLQNVLGRHGIDWQSPKGLQLFAYGPGKPGDKNNVWSKKELPRLLALIEGTADDLKSTDRGSLARCLSVLEGKRIKPADIVKIASSQAGKADPSPAACS